MKTIRMPYPLESPASTTNAHRTNKIRIEQIDGDFYIEHLLPVYEMALDESGRVIDESAQPTLSGHQSAFVHTLRQTDLQQLAQDPGNAYTVWLNGVEVMNYTSTTLPASGPIGIQLHPKNEMSIDFKDIRVAEL